MLSALGSNLNEYLDVNNSHCLDLDATCFMMLTLDLLDLFGTMMRSMSRVAWPKDFKEFDGWFNVILDPIVVKVYASNDDKKGKLSTSTHQSFAI